MSGQSSLLKDLTKVDRSAYAPYTGLRAGAFIAAPLLVGIITGQSALIFSTLGALFLSNVDAPRAGVTPLRVLLAACFSQALAFGLGTLAGTTGIASIPLMAAGVFVPLALSARRGWPLVGATTAIFYAVGVGLPGGSVSDASIRLAFALLGSLWQLSGTALERLARSREQKPAEGPAVQFGPVPIPSDVHSARWAGVHPEVLERSAVAAVACSLGLALGIALGLPRDFWVVVTIIIALRPARGATLSLTTGIVVGTICGAAVGAAMTLSISNDYLLWALLLFFAVAINSTRGMNFALTQAFLAPFIIIILNIIYPGQWQLAEVRILDVAIGGAIALTTSYLLTVRWKRPVPLDASAHLSKPQGN